MYQVLFLASVVALASCQYGHGQSGYNGVHHHGEDSHDEYAEPHYSFEYSVKDPHTGDYHSHKEERKGDHTQGEYFLVEPDGSKRNVVYKVEGKSGFLAEVHREAGKGGYGQQGYHQPQEQGYYRPQQPTYYKQQEPTYYKQQKSLQLEQSYKQPSYQAQAAYKVHQPQHHY